MLHDGFGMDEAVRAQADWLAGAGYLALSVDLGFWGRPAACLLRMFGDLRAGRGQTFGQVDADHDIKVYPDAGHAFLHQPAAEPGPVAGILARITHAGYHEPSAQDARRRIVAFFDAHLKT